MTKKKNKKESSFFSGIVSCILLYAVHTPLIHTNHHHHRQYPSHLLPLPTTLRPPLPPQCSGPLSTLSVHSPVHLFYSKNRKKQNKKLLFSWCLLSLSTLSLCVRTLSVCVTLDIVCGLWVAPSP